MRTRRSGSFASGVVLVVSAVVSVVSYPVQARAQQAVVRDVRLHPGDAVRIEVEDEPALSGQFAVGPEGTVMFPMLGLVPIADRPFDELQQDLHTRYAKEIVDPVIRVTPILRIPVMGEVRQPGLHMIDPTESLQDVIARAGGLLQTANPRRITLLRNGKAFVSELQRSGTRADLGLQSGDEIFVARRGWFGENMPILVSAAASVMAAAVTTLIVRR
jgi:protein involved in polysaccharide export with SLBB domain